jgi:hypothetical protein
MTRSLFMYMKINKKIMKMKLIYRTGIVIFFSFFMLFVITILYSYECIYFLLLLFFFFFNKFKNYVVKLEH